MAFSLGGLMGNAIPAGINSYDAVTKILQEAQAKRAQQQAIKAFAQWGHGLTPQQGGRPMPMAGQPPQGQPMPMAGQPPQGQPMPQITSQDLPPIPGAATSPAMPPSGVSPQGGMSPAAGAMGGAGLNMPQGGAPAQNPQAAAIQQLGAQGGAPAQNPQAAAIQQLGAQGGGQPDMFAGMSPLVKSQIISAAQALNAGQLSDEGFYQTVQNAVKNFQPVSNNATRIEVGENRDNTALTKTTMTTKSAEQIVKEKDITALDLQQLKGDNAIELARQKGITLEELATIRATGQQAVADTNKKASDYKADKGFEGTQYKADKGFEGTQYKVDAYTNQEVQDRLEKAREADQKSQDTNRGMYERYQLGIQSLGLKKEALLEKAQEANRKANDVEASLDERKQARMDADQFRQQAIDLRNKILEEKRAADQAKATEANRHDVATEVLAATRDGDKNRHNLATEGQADKNEAGRNARQDKILASKAEQIKLKNSLTNMSPQALDKELNSWTSLLSKASQEPDRVTARGVISDIYQEINKRRLSKGMDPRPVPEALGNSATPTGTPVDAATGVTGDTVEVLDPTGKPGSIPASQLEEALKVGYKKL